MDKFVDRLKSPVFWVSLLMLILTQFQVTEKLNISNEQLQTFIDVFVNIFIVGGLLNNPKNNCFSKSRTLLDE